MLDNNVLLVFIKYPKAGYVKTRLAKAIGSKNAALLYKIFTETVVKRIKSTYYKIFVFYMPVSKRKEVISWLGDDLNYYSQKGIDLGQRLKNAFKIAFENGAKKVVVIGTDSPLIEQKEIKDAFAKLNDRECVIGPSRDGGYYLLGLKKYNADVFKDIKWSTEKVFSQTVGKLEESNAKFLVLDFNFDIDNVEDLCVLKKELDKTSDLHLDNLNKCVNRVLEERAIIQ